MDFGIFVTIWKFIVSKDLHLLVIAFIILSIVPFYKRTKRLLDDWFNVYKSKLDSFLVSHETTKNKINDIASNVIDIKQDLKNNINLTRDKYTDLLSKLQSCQNDLKDILVVIERNFSDLSNLTSKCKDDMILKTTSSKSEEKLDKIMLDNVKICEVLNNIKSVISRLDNLITLTMNRSNILVSKFDDSDLLQSLNKYKRGKENDNMS